MDGRSGHILLKNSKPGFSGVCQNLPGDEIVEYRAIVNVELFSQTYLFANKRVFQQNRHEAVPQNEKAANFNLAAFFRLTVEFP